MNNIIISLKRFLKNKNTVTIMGVVVIIAILYFGYNMQIDNATTPISVPVAKINIQPRTLITSDMIEYIEVAPIMLNDAVIRATSAILNKSTNYNTLIPKGSLFYKGVLVNASELPDSAFVEVKKGQIPYNFPVDMASTYGNSIFPGNMIDIYMKAVNDAGQVMVGKLIENVEVLAVKDSNGKHVFENSDLERVPSTLIFGVTDEIHILLLKASYMSAYSVDLFPVPHGGTTTVVGDLQVSTQQLKDFINANTVTISEAVTPGV